MRQHLERLTQWGWNLYEVAVILAGAVAAVYVSIRFSEQVNQEEDALFFLGILLLYVLFDLFRLPYKDQAISLGFPIALFALLGSQQNGPLIVAEIVMLGSLCSESLHRLRAGRKLLIEFDRVLFYAAHHTLASMVAMDAFDLARRQRGIPPSPATEAFDVFADPDYLLAIVVYIVVYSLVSSMLILPHDLAIRSLRLPQDEERLPRVHPIGSVVLMAPVPIALSVFLFALEGTSRLILSLVFPALFLAFLIIARSYANIERETISRRSQEKVRRRLLGLTRFDEELLDSISDLVHQLLRSRDDCWIALYSVQTDDNTLWLRGERDQAGRVRTHPTGNRTRPEARQQSDAVSDTYGGSDTVRWPRQAKPGQGLLGQALDSRLAQSGLRTQADLPVLEADPLLPPGTAYLYIPLQNRDGVVGLLTLARPRRRFIKTDLDRLTPLADVLSQSLINIQQFEKQIDELYNQVEDYVADPTVVKRALENLVARGITRMNEILALIPERAFQKRFNETLDAFAEERAGSLVCSLDDADLAAIYNEVHGREVGGMPPLDEPILSELRTVASSLSAAFSFHQQFERDRSVEYIPLYRVCRDALKAETIQDIIDLRKRVQDALNELDATEGIPGEVTLVLSRLDVAIVDLEQSERADRIDVRREELKNALVEEDAVEQTVSHLEATLRLILVNWLAHWKRIILAALSAVGAAEAELDLALGSRQALSLERINVVLQVRNVGHGVATQTVAELLPQAGYEVVGDPRFNLGVLQTDKDRKVKFVIEPKRTDVLRLVFRVSYRDIQDTRPRTLDFADQFFLQGELPTFRQVDNPYVAGRPLPKGSPVFFGRDDLFRFIRQNLALSKRREPQVLVLVGERRMGKTSIALQLPLRLRSEGYIHVYFDTQSAVDTGQFLLTLGTRITESLQGEGIAIDCPNPKEFLFSPGYAFEHRFLPRVWEGLGERRLLIVIDEYETLERRVESGKEDRAMFDYLRSLIQHKQWMTFVFFGSLQMHELTSDYWHVLFNIAKHRPIGLLSPEEARQLIKGPVQGEIVYDELAVKEILEGTGRHPYFLQMVCDKLVEGCNVNQVSYVTVQEVREALREVVKTGKPHLEWLWNSTSAEERVVLTGLAECLRDGALGTAEAIIQRARLAEHRLELDTARWALGRLVGRQILKRPLEGADFYEFTASLYYTWIRSACPLA